MTVPANIFARRLPDGVTGRPVLIKIVDVDEAHAHQMSVSGHGGTYDMPIKDYDTLFILGWRPATEDDMGSLGAPDDGFRLPANAPKSWGGDGPELPAPPEPKGSRRRE